MKTVRILVIIFIVVTAVYSCKSKISILGNQFNRITECISTWEYLDLKAQEYLVVLHYFPSPAGQPNPRYPNMVFGINSSHDTIAVLDFAFNGVLSEGDSLKTLPAQWSRNQKESMKPLVIASDNRNVDELYCSVKFCYWGALSIIE